MTIIHIRNAELYDPLNNRTGETGDLWIEGGKIAAPPPDGRADQEIDARGMIVAPAGIEPHSHVAGAQLNAGRTFLAGKREINRLLPSPAEAARRYLHMGYTTVMDAAMPPLYAWNTHRDLEAMAGISRGAYTLMGDHTLLLDAVESGDLSLLKDVIGWLLEVSGGYTVKLVNPGAATCWKMGRPLPGLDDPVRGGALTQRRIIQMAARAVNELGLPHGIHLHARQLGVPGNWTSFCETIRALEGQRAHLCHIQFFCYGADDRGGMTSEAVKVAELLASQPALTADVGQVLFGVAMATTADIGAIGYLHDQIGGARYSRWMEGEGGGSLLPLDYLEKDASAAVQWATGLELLLSFPDPARLFLTSDHPNGGPFTAYPLIIQWLMSADARNEMLEKIHPAARNKTGLAGITREYSLAEIITMTSGGPAGALGLTDRGSLCLGARADLRCYRRSTDLLEMFSQPAWVMRGGEILSREGKIAGLSTGETLVVRPEWDRMRAPEFDRQLGQKLSFDPRHYALRPWIQEKHFEVAPCSYAER